MNNSDVLQSSTTAKRFKLSAILPQVILHLVIVLLFFILLYPLCMTFFNALKNDVRYEISPWYPMFPLKISNIATAFRGVYRYMINTVIVAAVGGAGLIFIASISAFTFARMQFYGRKILFSMVIALMMIPSVLTLFPLLTLYKQFNLTNSLFTLIVPLWTSGPVFGTYLLHIFFRGLPKDVFEAAKIDGASDFRCFYMIALPLCMPILGTLAIMTLVNIWNDYLWPLTTITDHTKFTISAGLKTTYAQVDSGPVNMPITFAAYLVSSIPLILVFVFANRYYVQGLTGSGIKM